MELDNIIYIVITVAIFLLSIFGHFRKKKTTRPYKPEETIYSLNDFERILEKKEEYFRNEEVVVENLTPPTSEISEAEPVVNNTATTELLPDDQNKEEEFNDGFDIKSAILYSSILERKKFRH